MSRAPESCSRSWRVLVALAVGLSLGRVAFAQPNELASPPTGQERDESLTPLAQSLQGDAKRDYDLGRLLYDNGDFQGALLRFQNARQASGDARLLWNAAVCEKALRHYAKAAALMREFLNANPADTSESTRLRAREFALAAESLSAPLEVTSNVRGAVVSVDSDRPGPTPLPVGARIDWGSHQILVKKPGYIEYAQTVNVAGPGVVRVAAVLRPVVHEGRIIVRAGSSQTIAIDGRTIAWGSWEGALSSGRHSLRVAGEGFVPLQRQILVMDAQTQGFDITLEHAGHGALPTWVWLVGGSVLAAGAATAGYFIFKPDSGHVASPGDLATIQLH